MAKNVLAPAPLIIHTSELSVEYFSLKWKHDPVLKTTTQMKIDYVRILNAEKKRTLSKCVP